LLLSVEPSRLGHAELRSPPLLLLLLLQLAQQVEQCTTTPKTTCVKVSEHPESQQLLLCTALVYVGLLSDVCCYNPEPITLPATAMQYNTYNTCS
jgi:hypothetical protein